jgi:hypothetical protein
MGTLIQFCSVGAQTEFRLSASKVGYTIAITEAVHCITANVSESLKRYYGHFKSLTVIVDVSSLLQKTVFSLHSLTFGASHRKLTKQELVYQNSYPRPSKTVSPLQPFLDTGISGLINMYVRHSHVRHL